MMTRTGWSWKGAGVLVTADFEDDVTEPVTLTLRPPGAENDDDDVPIAMTSAGERSFEARFIGDVVGTWKLDARSADDRPAILEGTHHVRQTFL